MTWPNICLRVQAIGINSEAAVFMWIAGVLRPSGVFATQGVIENIVLTENPPRRVGF